MLGQGHLGNFSDADDPEYCYKALNSVWNVDQSL